MTTKVSNEKSSSDTDNGVVSRGIVKRVMKAIKDMKKNPLENR